VNYPPPPPPPPPPAPPPPPPLQKKNPSTLPSIPVQAFASASLHDPAVVQAYIRSKPRYRGELRYLLERSANIRHGHRPARVRAIDQFFLTFDHRAVHSNWSSRRHRPRPDRLRARWWADIGVKPLACHSTLSLLRVFRRLTRASTNYIAGQQQLPPRRRSRAFSAANQVGSAWPFNTSTLGLILCLLFRTPLFCLLPFSTFLFPKPQ